MVSKPVHSHTVFIVEHILFESCDNYLQGLLLEVIELIYYMACLYGENFLQKGTQIFC